MEYIIFLNKFEIDINKLKNKIEKLGRIENIKEEENRIIIEGELEVNKLKELQEVKQVVEIINIKWRELKFKDLQEDCLKLVNKYKLKEYAIKTEFLNKIPLSAKSIYKHVNPYLKHEDIIPNENSNNQVYIQIKKEEGKVSYRIGYSEIKKMEKAKSKLIAILEEPELTLEIGDFFRLCKIFKLKLIIVSKNKEIEKIIKKAKEETKGIDYEEFELEVLEEMPENLEIIGFSKHSKDDEEKLIELLKEGKEYGLLFGNDKYGLTQKARDRADYMIRLTSEDKKPLRASHALSYIMGIGYSLK